MPEWLHLLSILFVAVGLLCAIWIAVDVTRAPQHMWIMNVVWPMTGLYGGLLAVAGYYAYGKAKTRQHARAQMQDGEGMSSMTHTPFPAVTGKAATHCGAGCTLGDICAEWLAFAFPALAVWFGWKSVFADRIFAVWVLDFVLAFGFGIAFQYFTIKPMRGLTPFQGIVAAVKADTLSLTAWQVGMYGFMAIAHFWIFGSLLGVRLVVDSIEFWFMMQIAMLFGFVTSYPVNWWLIRTGVKEKM